MILSLKVQIQLLQAPGENSRQRKRGKKEIMDRSPVVAHFVEQSTHDPKIEGF
jgi:hypothetical protein